MPTPSQDLIAVVDVETTGLSPWRSDRIVEIAVILMSPSGTIHREYETLVNPERDMGPSRIHQITSAEVINAPRFSDIAGDLVKLLRGAHVLAGHNISFDRSFLVAEYRRIGLEVPQVDTLCTCRLLGYSNLRACCDEFGIKVDGNHHRALTDARATAAIIHRLLEDDPSLLESGRRQCATWPSLHALETACVRRQDAQSRLSRPPRFLERIAAIQHYDTDTTTSDIVAYLTLIDRFLEDRVLDPDEEESLVEAASQFGLGLSQVRESHQTYIQNLAIHALADGVVTEAERKDLHLVCRLLGQSVESLEQVLTSARAQLERMETRVVSHKRSGPASGHTLEGKSVCFTGELQARINGEHINRTMAEALAKKAGMTACNNVTMKLDFLVVADPNTQSGKAKKARKYGTRIVADAVFWKMIGVAVE